MVVVDTARLCWVNNVWHVQPDEREDMARTFTKRDEAVSYCDASGLEVTSVVPAPSWAKHQ